ncbi:MAG: MYXO-CTERM sorting domain-containing protein [Planctomycetota bacterium]|jgi:uncharacterized protein (TIGR03382 family)
MDLKGRPVAWWVLVIVLALSVVLILMGQTMAVVDYDLTVSLGLQESADEIGGSGVEVNRAFGAGDTVVYLPLLVASLVGLVMRRRWALVVTAGATAVTAYWSAVVIFMFLFLPGAPGYDHTPAPATWVIVGAYLVFGVWGFLYVLLRGEALVREG